MNLFWVDSDDGKNMVLFAGELGDQLAWLQRAPKTWQIVTWVCGDKPQREYDTLDRQMDRCETAVREWFAKGMALSGGEALEYVEALMSAAAMDAKTSAEAAPFEYVRDAARKMVPGSSEPPATETKDATDNYAEDLNEWLKQVLR